MNEQEKKISGLQNQVASSDDQMPTEVLARRTWVKPTFEKLALKDALGQGLQSAYAFVSGDGPGTYPSVPGK